MFYRAKAVFLHPHRRRKERIMATWIVGGVLLVIVGAIIWKMIKDKKSGNSACSCGGDCGKCKGCH
jgi:hypothetical protein